MRLDELFEDDVDYSTFGTRMARLGRKMFGSKPSSKTASGAGLRSGLGSRPSQYQPWPEDSAAIHQAAEQWQKAYARFQAGEAADPGPIPLSRDDLRKVNFQRKRMRHLSPIEMPAAPTPAPAPTVAKGTTTTVGGVEYVWNGTEWRDATTGKPATARIEAAIKTALGL